MAANSMPEHSELLPKVGAARLLGMSVPKFNELLTQYPDFPKPVRLTPNGRWRYRTAELRAFVQSLTPSR